MPSFKNDSYLVSSDGFAVAVAATVPAHSELSGVSCCRRPGKPQSALLLVFTASRARLVLI